MTAPRKPVAGEDGEPLADSEIGVSVFILRRPDGKALDARPVGDLGDLTDEEADLLISELERTIGRIRRGWRGAVLH